MIIGIGSDLSDIRRIEKTLERFGERFTNKVFTEIERKRYEARPPNGEHGHHFSVRGLILDGAFIVTLEGVMTANAGDWIIRGVKGEIYPCKPDIFEATYEPCED